jgi:hypothetical protein
MTSQEHTKAPTTRPMAGRVVNVGFSGTYTDEGAEAGATALIGKRSVRYDAILRLLVADWGTGEPSVLKSRTENDLI